MTPARKKALQWFHDQGVVKPPLILLQPIWLTETMFRKLLRSQEVEITNEGWCLTDKGRRALHGDDV